MRNPKRLDGFYETLKEAHKNNVPDWRFGQLMVNLVKWLYDTKKCGDIFFVEDDKMEGYIKEFLQDYDCQ